MGLKREVAGGPAQAVQPSSRPKCWVPGRAFVVVISTLVVSLMTTYCLRLRMLNVVNDALAEYASGSNTSNQPELPVRPPRKPCTDQGHWEAPDSSSPVYIPPPHCTFDREAALDCLAGEHVLVLGDSFSRFRYLNLAQLMRNGWRVTPRNVTPPSAPSEVSWQDWEGFYRATSSRAGDACDCFRAGNVMPTIVENRYWFGPRSIRMTYIQHYVGGDYRIHGHAPSFVGAPCWEAAEASADPDAARLACSKGPLGCSPGQCNQPNDFQLSTLPEDYAATVLELVKMYRPTILLAAVYYWSRSWPAQAVIDAFRALKANATFVRRFMWVGGTPTINQVGTLNGSEIIPAIRAAGFEAFDAAEIMAPVAAFPRSALAQLYTEDGGHYGPEGYAAMNQGILGMLCGARSPGTGGE